MKLTEMIATRERLADALSWEKRVALCGDSATKEKATEEVANLEFTLGWLAPRIKNAQERADALERNVVMIALWACIALEMATAVWAVIHFHVFF